MRQSAKPWLEKLFLLTINHMFGSAAAQASGCSSAPSGFYPHKQLQSTEYFPLELCLPLWPPIPTRLPTPLLPIFLLHPFPVATSPPCPTDGSRRWRPQPPHQRRTRREGMLRCAALRELTPLHTCTHTRRGTASLITNVWGITLKNKCVLEWSRSCGSAHHISLMHTCAQGVFNLDYINSVPTLQKDFKNAPNNRRTISSIISCSQVGLFMHIRCWSPIPPK